MEGQQLSQRALFTGEVVLADWARSSRLGSCLCGTCLDVILLHNLCLTLCTSVLCDIWGLQQLPWQLAVWYVLECHLDACFLPCGLYRCPL